MFENSVLFVTYNHFQDMIRRYSSRNYGENVPLTMTQLSMAGFLSGAAVSFVLTPVELIKCRLQSQTGQHYRGPLSVISHTLRQEGISGLFRGHLGTVLREAFGGAAWFGTYELVVRQFLEKSPHAKTKDDLSTWQLMTAGALSGVSYNAALFPADVIKSRQQSSDARESFRKVASDLYRKEGVKGFYRGFGITIARSAPTSAVIFATYEWLNRNLVVEF
jgi:ornithine carrier protein